jgi:hypothetical protein
MAARLPRRRRAPPRSRPLAKPRNGDADALRAELARVMREGDAAERTLYAGLIRFELQLRGEPYDKD